MDIQELLGKTFTKIEGKKGSEELKFYTDDNIYRMYHEQDCCECVEVEDICGDFADLIGTPVVDAFEKTNSEEHPEGFDAECRYLDDSFTWTFYTIRTKKGAVTIRWLGSSNGYYSESVTLEIAHKISFAPNLSN